MATIDKVAVYPVKTRSGNSPEKLYFPEAATQSFKKGEMVYLSGGKVTVCGADPTLIAGFAAEDASGTTDTKKPVWIANADTIFSANIYHPTETSAVTAVSDVGTNYGLVTVSNKTHVDKSETTNTRVTIVELSSLDNVGDTYGRVHFIIGGKYRQLDNDIG